MGPTKKDIPRDFPVSRTDEEWREILSPDQYRVLRQGGTERPGTGNLLSQFSEGEYRCAGCGQELFSSNEKFESGSGWPSWTAPIAGDKVKYIEDTSFGMKRTEVVCSGCGGHLGHVFDDGPTASSQRF